MKRLLGLLLIAVVLLLPMAALAADPPATAAVSDPLVVPRASSAPAYGTNGTPLYDDERFPIWNYTFEGDFFDVAGYNTIYFITNQMLVMKAWLLKTALRATEYALTQSFFDPLSLQAGNALTVLGNALWTINGAPLVAGALSLAALWALWLYLRGRTSRLWGVIAGSLLIVMVTTGLMGAGAEPVRAMVSLSRDLGLAVYRGVESTTGTGGVGNSLASRAGDSAWRQLVFQPWAAGALGSKEGNERFRYPNDTLDAARFLNMTQDYRRRYVPECQPSSFSQQQTYCPWWNVQFLPRRFFLAGSTFLFTMVYGGAIFILAGGILIAQMTLLFFVALLPVWLLFALWWPGGGVRLTGRILTAGFAALVSQVVLAATLSVLLAISLGVGTGFSSGGWLLQGMVLAALGLVAYRYRFAWLWALRSRSRREGESEPGLLEYLRGWLGRTARPAAGAGAGAASLAGVPLFAALQGLAAAAPSAVPVERTTVIERERSEEPQAPREVFFSEMRTLRDQMTLRSEVFRDGERIARDRPMGKQPDAEETAPAGGTAGASNAVADRARRNDMLNLGQQRPKE